MPPSILYLLSSLLRHDYLLLKTFAPFVLHCIAQIFRWPVAIPNGDLLAPRRQVTAKVRHPERRRGIWERFLPEFTLSLPKGSK